MTEDYGRVGNVSVHMKNSYLFGEINRPHI